MRRFVIAVALACALSATALAGEIPSTGAPTPGSTQGIGAPAPGDMGNGGYQGNGGEMGSGGLAALFTILDLAF
jgi:hypothetical protein